MKQVENHTIAGVLQKNLITILEEKKLLAEINKGNIRCNFCKTVITTENIGAIKIVEGKFVFYCSNLKCIDSTKLG